MWQAHRSHELVLGDERRGLEPEDRSICDELARIPVAGDIDSLNVGVAAGILMYEVWRRGGARSPNSLP